MLVGYSQDNRPINDTTPTPTQIAAPNSSTNPSTTPEPDITSDITTPTENATPTGDVLHTHHIGDHPQSIVIDGRTFEILPSAEFLYEAISFEKIPSSDPWQCTSWVDEYGVFYFEPLAGTKLGPVTLDIYPYDDIVLWAEALGVPRSCISYTLFDFMLDGHAVSDITFQKSGERSYIKIEKYGNVHYVDNDGNEMVLRNMAEARSEFVVPTHYVVADGYRVFFTYDYATFVFIEPIINYWQEGKTVAEFRKFYGFPDYGEPFFGG